jgi:hypothetical protein
VQHPGVHHRRDRHGRPVHVKTKPNRAALKQLDALLEGRKRAPQLATLAKFIEAEIKGVRTRLEEGYCNTDRKPRGLRYITRPGKGRRGTQLKVFGAKGVCIFDHNSAETYRHNSEVVRWIRDQLEGHGK